MPFHDDMFEDADDQESFGHGRDWQELYFSSEEAQRQQHVHWVTNGPLGNSRLASTQELLALKRDARENPDNYVRLLSTYAIAHNPKPTIVDMGPLAVPMGVDSPNIAVVGRAGSGKTQSVTLPAALHAIRSGWSMVYINIKGKKQTRLLRQLAKCCGRAGEVQLISPLKLDRTLGTTCLEGCSSLSKANEVAACIVATAARRSRYGEGAWCYNQAQEWLQHAIAAICTDLPPSRRNLNELRDVVLAGDYEKFADAHPDFPVLERFAGQASGGNRNTETVMATISECTAFIEEIRAFLSKDEVSFERFAQHGGCIIVEIDQAEIKRLRPIVTLLLGKVISSLQRAANADPRGCIRNKTVVIIDELIASGPIPGLAEALHTCRELGFSFIAGAQALSQLANIYADEAQAVLDGFQTQIAFGGGLDWGTAEHFSRRTGVGTMALPGIQESVEGDGNGDITFSRQWQMAPRPMLLPSEIASPQPHPLLGMPVTIIAGDGKTPPFQAYLTPSHAEGAIARMMEELESNSVDNDLRPYPLEYNPRRQSSRSGRRDDPGFGFTKTHGWSQAQLKQKIAVGLQALNLKEASPEAREWWRKVQEAHQSQLNVLVRLIEELLERSSTIDELHEASEKGRVNDIKAILIYMEFMRRKREISDERRPETQHEEDTPESSPELFDVTSDDEADVPAATALEDKLTFRRCGACRSLVPAHANRCRICGST